MAVNVSKRANGRSAAQRPSLDAEAALRTANGFLVDSIGDLLMAESPRLSDGRWIMTITVGDVIEGMLGEAGTRAVDAASAWGLVAEGDRPKVKPLAAARA